MFRPICPPAFFRCLVSKFLRRSMMIFIIKGFQIIIFVFIVISTTFRPICPPAFFRCLVSKFLRRSLMIFIIKGFQTIVYIFIVISTMFRPICPPAFFRCLSNSGTFMELQTTSFIESTGVACSGSDSHNWEQVLIFLYCYSPAVKKKIIHNSCNSTQVRTLSYLIYHFIYIYIYIYIYIL